MRQAHQHLVPALLELNLHDGARREVFICQAARGVVLRDRGIGLLPRGCGNLCAVYPKLRASAVPLACWRRGFISRTAVSIKFHLRPGCLRHGRIYVSPGVSRLPVGGVGEERGHGGVPNMAQIDARTRGHLRPVSSAVVSERGGQHAVLALVGRFGRELHRLVAVVGEGVSDAPAHVGLFHVGDRLVFEHVRFVEEEAAFKVGKLFKFLARVR